MARKRSQKRGFPYLGCFFIVAIIVFAGIIAGFYLLQNGNPFPQATPDAISMIQEVNPDFTPVATTNTVVTPDTNPNSATFADILSDLNAVRQNEGLGTIRINSLLNAAAAQQALYNASIMNAKHEDINGNLAEVRVGALGYIWASVGENLLGNWSIDGHEVFTLWQNSPIHNENMMNPVYTEVGLAYMVTPIGQVYHAMVLATPQQG